MNDEQAKWEKILEKNGLGMRAGSPNWLVYGNDYNTQKAAPGETSHYRTKKRLKPHQIAKQRVWNHIQEAATPARPDWGYAGGYDPDGKVIKWNPVKEVNRKVTEEQLCKKIAVNPRAK